MSENLETSTARLIMACRSIKDWAEQVLNELESRQAQFQAGRAELDKSLADLREQRANYIKESSEKLSSETCVALDALSERMEDLLAIKPKEETAAKPVPPAPTPIPDLAGPETAVSPPAAQRGAKTEASEKPKVLPEEAAA